MLDEAPISVSKRYFGSFNDNWVARAEEIEEVWEGSDLILTESRCEPLEMVLKHLLNKLASK